MSLPDHEIQPRLKNYCQADKTSDSTSVDEARSSVDTLKDLIHQVLQSNQDLSWRLGNLETLSINHTRCSRLDQTTDPDDDASTKAPERRNRNSVSELEEAFVGHFQFDEDLNTSRVYSRPRRRKSADSLRSSAAFSLGWSSCLSGVSLAEVSNIAVFSLPIDIHELSNGIHYKSNSQNNEPGDPTTEEAEATLPGDAKNTEHDDDSIEGTGSLISSSPSVVDERRNSVEPLEEIKAEEVIQPRWDVTKPISLATRLHSLRESLKAAPGDAKAVTRRIESLDRSVTELLRLVNKNVALGPNGNHFPLLDTVADRQRFVECCQKYQEPFLKLINDNASIGDGIWKATWFSNRRQIARCKHASVELALLIYSL